VFVEQNKALWLIYKLLRLASEKGPAAGMWYFNTRYFSAVSTTVITDSLIVHRGGSVAVVVEWLASPEKVNFQNLFQAGRCSFDDEVTSWVHMLSFDSEVARSTALLGLCMGGPGTSDGLNRAAQEREGQATS
jgi:hypothetical protein